jgi:hypothetical protein
LGGGYAMEKNRETLGICILSWHPPEYRKLTKEERLTIDEKKKELNQTWFKKEDVKRLGVFNPVWGTKYSTMEFWEFPNLQSVAEYRHEISKIEGHVTFFEFLLGTKAHWIK